MLQITYGSIEGKLITSEEAPEGRLDEIMPAYETQSSLLLNGACWHVVGFRLAPPRETPRPLGVTCRFDYDPYGE